MPTLKIEFFPVSLPGATDHHFQQRAITTFSSERSPPSAASGSPPSAASGSPRGTRALSGYSPIVSTPSVAAGAVLAIARCAHIHRMCALMLKCRAKVHKHKIIQKTFFSRVLWDKAVISGPFRCQFSIKSERKPFTWR